MNMHETDNEILQIEVKTEEDEKTQYHIYEYFKQHSSAFWAAASAFIAAISIVLNFAAFSISLMNLDAKISTKY